ncbi:MATE efflux family protein (macronuclear) [Tetrahymena thermophila SB210]|uniref:MATE efflux family protein n=1 Tax=Tetrahymena thermophila (strain SB210) TaxID=312017 RepID=I7M7R3_TETTS|nr:MATE efflux family protein [Tetrahymena thermophila SB210]EAR95692.2 MATE efflux family protein [Tetrahymena thermophila SB210]|eukprot:XP_001015937.2 MATE efflux family protein [Tetrahymena thermophila SB210]
MQESSQQNLNGQNSSDKINEPLLNKQIPVHESEAPPKKDKNKITFLQENELTRENVPRQIYDLIVESIPNVATNLGIFYYNFINMFFVRQIGSTQAIASFGMGVTWFNSTTLCVLVSIGSGLFIQLAQAYGAKNFKLMTELYQRCQAINMAIGIISGILLYNTKNVLIALGINEEISSLTEEFSLSCIPSIFATVFYDTTKQLFFSQNVFDIPMKVQLIVYFIHPFWCFIFSIMFEFGISGMGIARTVSELSGYLLLCFFIKKRHLFVEIWNQPYNFQSMFQEWIPFLKISIPVGSLVFLEWIFFELQTIIVAMLDDANILAGQTSFTSIIMFFYMVPLGLSYTTNSYLGNAVGEGKKRQCQNFSKISMMTCFVEFVIMLFVGILLKGFFTGIFSTGPEMEHYFTYAYDMYLYTFLLGDYYQVILNGILRCCDLQNYAAYSYFFVYYFVGLPLTYFFTFPCGLGLGGVWLSQSFSATAVSIIFYLRILKIDWDQSIQQVQKRVQFEKLNIQDVEMKQILQNEISIDLLTPPQMLQEK